MFNVFLVFGRLVLCGLNSLQGYIFMYVTFSLIDVPCILMLLVYFVYFSNRATKVTVNILIVKSTYIGPGI